MTTSNSIIAFNQALRNPGDVVLISSQVDSRGNVRYTADDTLHYQNECCYYKKDLGSYNNVSTARVGFGVIVRPTTGLDAIVSMLPDDDAELAAALANFGLELRKNRVVNIGCDISVDDDRINALNDALRQGIPHSVENTPGRPVGSGEGRTVTFRLLLTPDERERLNELAAEQGQTPSQFVRERIFK